ncbi:MAG: ribonuclease H-like domain-containing protein [Nitrospira sp.]|nr:ribonuclease H-like domain-containing protein [Nitrospira sp.]MBX7041092.1 ribonuclease H-like domain-containing protein [Nitrospira sp.]MCW5793742.1 ribonuclease H-like domain-containing protein [Nitrospira sp.]HMU31918.1 3'-5' exonuclease [Nitrospira sp.]HMV59063.1 3'-5' exonuclease [Nitrospira sp.]
MKVVLDIETVQAPREEWARIAGRQLTSGEVTFAESGGDLFAVGEAEAQQRLDDELYEKSSFDGTFSKIVCIGLLEFTDTLEPRGAISWYGGNEQALLRAFWSHLGQSRPSLFITHNGLNFDLPFIKKRSIIQQVKPSMEINLAKFRAEPVYDTMAIWSNWDNRGWVKLDVLARALNVESKSGSGSQVAQMWADGQGKEIALYCLQDTYVTYGCYCRMNFRPPISREIVLLKPELVDVG